MRAAVWVTIAGVGAALASAGPAPAGAPCSVPLFPYRTGILVLSEGGRMTRVRVQLADTPDRLEVGLMCRPALDPDAGMLFVFPTSTRTAFWMKNTLIPLAIAFIDSDWHIVRIMEMAVAPDPAEGPFAFYEPDKPFRYALEVNAGFFAKHEISERAEVRFIPPEGGGPPTFAPAAP
ncbi:MAG TPA: DUF192 domain-containing protein [bacterium]|nr:DUF192 domain-containing protein [bacterium]